MMSTEAAIMHAVIENRHDDAIEMIKTSLFDGELIEFYESVSQLLDLLAADAERRGIR